MFEITKNKIKLQSVKNFRGQRKLVFDAIVDNGGKATAIEVIDAVAPRLKTKSTAGRIVRWYLSELKHNGLLKATGRECDDRCLFAKSDASDCDCSCEGRNHGSKGISRREVGVEVK